MIPGEITVAGVVDVEDLADLDQAAPVVVMQVDGRVLLNLSPDAAAAVACMVARHETAAEETGVALFGQDWIHVVVQLVVTAAALREPKPVPMLVPFLRSAS